VDKGGWMRDGGNRGMKEEMRVGVGGKGDEEMRVGGGAKQKNNISNDTRASQQEFTNLGINISSPKN